MEIPGLGFLSTSWVGKRGQDELVQTIRRRTDAIKVTELKKELKTLASVCLQGLTSGDASDIHQAVNLCHEYVPKVKSAQPSKTIVAELWKNAASTSHCAEDKVHHATAVLGEKIVAKITEAHRDPPHVSIIRYIYI